MSRKTEWLSIFSAGLILALVAACQSASDATNYRLGGKTPAEMYADKKIIELVEAVLNDDADRVTALASSGTPVDEIPAGGVPPLIWAVHFDRKNALRALLSGGADACLPVPAIYGDSPLVVVLRTEKSEQLELLLSMGVDPNCSVSDSNDLSPLGIASFVGPIENVQLLVDAGADVNVRNGVTTTVSLAQAGGNFDIVLLLLESGFDHSLVDVAFGTKNRGVSPEREFQREAVIKWLRERGVDYPPR